MCARTLCLFGVLTAGFGAALKCHDYDYSTGKGDLVDIDKNATMCISNFDDKWHTKAVSGYGSGRADDLFELAKNLGQVERIGGAEYEMMVLCVLDRVMMPGSETAEYNLRCACKSDNCNRPATVANFLDRQVYNQLRRFRH